MVSVERYQEPYTGLQVCLQRYRLVETFQKTDLLPFQLVELGQII
jgi:hypothetical protein